MRRRRFLLAAGALAFAPLGRAQQPNRSYRVGVLLPIAEAADRHLSVISDHLAKHGFVQDRNLTLDVRYSKTDPDAAQSLVDLKPDAILAASTNSVQAAQAATKTVPVVFTWVADPVLLGIVKNYARPGGNITGITNRYLELAAKRLELVRALLPAAKRVAGAGPFQEPEAAAALRVARQAARRLELELIVQPPFDSAYNLLRSVLKSGSQAILAFAQYEALGLRFAAANLVQVLAEKRMPCVFADTGTVAMGGLISYATNLDDDLRQGVDLISRVLKGDKPADLPVEQASRFELAINLKTARALGLTIPQSLLLRADRVIE